MSSDLNLTCSYALLSVAAAIGVGRALVSVVLGAIRYDRSLESSSTTALPRAAKELAYWALGPLARAAVAARISANAITASSLVLAFGAAVLLAFGQFGVAAVAMTVASLGDALDGLVARQSRTASPAGAIFDASVDRYQEFFLLGALAVYFRAEPIALVLALFAIGGSFMVSYGSAKAEALRVPVPEGIMRRAERAVCLSVGATLVPLAGKLVERWGLPAAAEYAPILVALLVIAVFANVSAVRRLRIVAALAPAPIPASAPTPLLSEPPPSPSLARHIATPEPKPPVFSADAE